jgi:hypothetical protein
MRAVPIKCQPANGHAASAILSLAPDASSTSFALRGTLKIRGDIVAPSSELVKWEALE